MKNTTILTILILFTAAGCKNPLQSEYREADSGQRLYTVSGKLIQNGAVPSSIARQNARTALPTLPGSVVYGITAVNTATPPVTRTGTVSNTAFTISLPAGTWNITVTGTAAGREIYSGTEQVTIAHSNLADISIPVYYTAEGGTGDIKLKIAVADSGAKSAKLSWEKTNGGTVPAPLAARTQNTDSGDTNISIEYSNVPSGTYNLTAAFYGETNGAGTVLYTCVEAVTVWNNLNTDTWQRSSSPSPITENGEFVLTKALVTQFIGHVLYVKGTGGIIPAQYTAGDSNAGTYYSPLKTVQAAVNKIQTVNDGTPYTIYIDGTVIGEDSDFGNANNAMANIVPGKPLTLTVKGYGAHDVLDAKRTDISKGRVLFIGADAQVTLEKLIITGGYVNDNGGGVYMDGGNISMTSGTIGGNAAQNGGGVYIDTGTFTITGGLIGGSDSATGNKTIAGGSGGGVYVSGGSLTMSGGISITGNTTGLNGSANNIYLSTGKTITVTGELKNTRPIGISMQTPGQFTAGYANGNAQADLWNRFSSDDAAFDVAHLGNEGQIIQYIPAQNIYLNGSGDNANDGSSAASAVKTFEQAKKLLDAGGTIRVCGTVIVDDTQNWTLSDKGSSRVERNAGFSGNLFSVTANGNLTLEGITIDGKGNVNGLGPSSGAVSNASALIKVSGGSLTLNSGAILQNNKGTGNGGGTEMVAGGTLYINDGAAIDNNIGVYGGGVSIENSAVIMTGGSISSNGATQWGGGIRMYGASSFTITDGTISNNTISSGQNGGGCFFQGGTVKMQGTPTISNNRTGTSTANNLRLQGATITVTGKLTNTTPIGITLDAGTGTFTTGYSTYNSGVEPGTVFSADNSSQTIVKDTNGEAAVQ